MSETLPTNADVEPIRATPGQWIALSMAGLIALVSSVAYPVYDRYTAHSITLVVTNQAGASAVIPPPAAIYLPARDTRGVNRLSPRHSVPILEDRIDRYMRAVPEGICRFDWTIRYSENSADLRSTRTRVFVDRQCP